MSRKPWKYLIAKDETRIKVDAEDYERVNRHSWRVIVTGKNQKQSVVTSLRLPKGVRTMSLGQFILKPPKGRFVYPRRWQGGLDYRKENLIVCTMAERQRLLPKRGAATNTSKYKGVSYIKKKKLWRARIEVDGKSIFIGDYTSEEKAARAYNNAAKKHFGALAYFNQIKPRSDRRQR